ncbi:uncharacterized protein LOC127240050 [Andrographis paniculata]|uniref:uncharacterized protein LOC127240050 n=1 Tax=Andrographis paniculata TaxID=175694 RepID=UPI0021E8B866|nr:uncharacterized protein LOC127240050 [Andrographis paniculata]
MALLFTISFFILLLLLLAPPQPAAAVVVEPQPIKSARLLDLVIRDYTFRSYNKNFKTGKLHKINLPANLSGIDVLTARFRCGSLRRYGARIKEFRLGVGVSVRACTKRVMLVRQNLGSNWSSLYYENYELSGYQLISPVLGLLAYNVGATTAATVPSELEIQAGKKPIIIDFGGTDLINTSSSSPGIIPLCANFALDGKVTLSNQARPNVCVATRDGHFGLVVESPLIPLRRKVSKWKIAIGSTIGAAMAAVLLSLLAVAMLVNAKKKARMEEMERRAYEEEALQVSMVGHVRALTATSTRTLPAIEHDESPI